MKTLKFIFLSLFGTVVAQNQKYENQNVLNDSTEQTNITRIVYPSEDTNKNRKPTHNRPPVADPRICNENELLYPGDNDGDWVCDCKPGYLHTPIDGRCYEAHTQGPCDRNYIITLLNTSSIPECVQNVCPQGKVYFNDQCFPLNSDEGCKEFLKYIGRKVLLVADPTTSGLICADEDFLYECVHNCCKGSKREHRNICKPSKKHVKTKKNS